MKQIKILHYARGVTPKRVTSGGAHLRGLAQGRRQTSWACPPPQSPCMAPPINKITPFKKAAVVLNFEY